MFDARARRVGVRLCVQHRIDCLFRRYQQIPGAILAGIANPGGERAVHPAAGTHLRQQLCRQLALQYFADGAQLQLRMTGERGVQSLQEVVAIVGVVLPGIFTVQRNQQLRGRRSATRLGGRLRCSHSRFDLGHAVPDGVVAMPGGIGEAQQVRELIVAKQAMQRLCWPLIEMRHILGAAIARTQATLQHVAAARRPLIASRCQQLKHRRAYRSFGGPATGWLHAESRLEHTLAFIEMPGDPLRAAGIVP